MTPRKWTVSLLVLLVMGVLVMSAHAQLRGLDDPPPVFPDDRIIIGDPGEDDEDSDDDDFASKVAGTYLDEGEIPEGSPFQGMQTLTASGTQYAQNLNALAGYGIQDDDPEATYSSAGQGVWKQTGDNSLKIVAIIYVYDATGAIVFIAKPNLELVFDEDFQTASGPLMTELFFPDQDPLTDAPFLVVEGFDTWRRLTVD